MIAQAELTHGEARKREADVLTREAQMILRTRHRISARTDIPPLVPEMEPNKLPLVPLDPAIPTNPNIVREFSSVSHAFLDSLPLKIQERLSILQCPTLDITFTKRA
jgi:hypothetical protein